MARWHGLLAAGEPSVAPTTDHHPTQSPCWAGGLLSAVGLAGLVVANTAFQLIATSAVTGVGVGFCQPTMAGMVRIWGDDVAPWMQALHAGFGVGMFISPLVIAVDLRESGSFHTACLGIAVTTALVSCLPLLLRSPPDPVARRRSPPSDDPRADDEEEADELSSLNAAASGEAPAKREPPGTGAILCASYGFVGLCACATSLNHGALAPAHEISAALESNR